MTELINSDDPPKPKSKGHRFQKGHTFSKGRRAVGKKTLREKLMNGLARSGEKRAKKAGHNGRIDGFTVFIENLADTNSSAAASLTSKLLSLEPPPTTGGRGGVHTINIHPVAHGVVFLPGLAHLAEYDVADNVWRAFRAGPEMWNEFLQRTERVWPPDVFENLRAQVAVDAASSSEKFIDDDFNLAAPPAPRLIEHHASNVVELNPRSSNQRLRELKTKLDELTPEDLSRLAELVGFEKQSEDET